MQRTPNLGLPLAVGGHVEMLNTLEEGFGKIAAHFEIELPFEGYGHVAPLESVNRNFEIIEAETGLSLPRVFSGHVALQIAVQSAFNIIDEYAGEEQPPVTPDCLLDLLPLPPEYSDGEQLPYFDVEGQSGEYVFSERVEVLSSSNIDAPLSVGESPIVLGFKVAAENPVRAYAGVVGLDGQAQYLLRLHGQASDPWTGVMWSGEGDGNPPLYSVPEDVSSTGWIAILPDGGVQLYLDATPVTLFMGDHPYEIPPLSTFVVQASARVESDEDPDGQIAQVEWITDARSMPKGVFPANSVDICGNPID